MKTRTNFYKHAAVIVLGTTFILMIPLVAMQFTDEVNWAIGDFVVIAIMLLGTGFTYELISRNVDKKYRTVIAIVLLLALMWLWAELAVGVFTNWGS